MRALRIGIAGRGRVQAHAMAAARGGVSDLLCKWLMCEGHQVTPCTRLC